MAQEHQLVHMKKEEGRRVGISDKGVSTTRLLSESGSPVHFTESRYCLLVAEDAPADLPLLQVEATHRRGASVRYSITGGNRDGLFTIDQHSGIITLAAALDYEAHTKHELVVMAEAGKSSVHSVVQVNVADINDNPPEFLETDFHVTVIEEDHSHLPATILKVEAVDADKIDKQGLSYTVTGDGLHSNEAIDKYFTITSDAELIQLKALDRDPPDGQESWQLKVQVRDGHHSHKIVRRPKRRNPRAVELGQSGSSSSTNSSFSSSSAYSSTSSTSSPFPLSSSPHEGEFHTSQTSFLPVGIHPQQRKYLGMGNRNMAKTERKPPEKQERISTLTEKKKISLMKRITRETVHKPLLRQNEHADFHTTDYPSKVLANSQTMGLSTNVDVDQISSMRTTLSRGIFPIGTNGSVATQLLQKVKISRNSKIDYTEVRANSSSEYHHTIIEGTGKTTPVPHDRNRRQRIRFLSRKRNHRIFMRGNTFNSPSCDHIKLRNDMLEQPPHTSDTTTPEEGNHEIHFPFDRHNGCRFEGYIKYHTASNSTKSKMDDSHITRSRRNFSRRHERRRRLRKSSGIVESDTINSNSPEIDPADYYDDEFIDVDARYVKHFITEDGGCQDYTLNPQSSYEDLQGIPEFLENIAARTSDPVYKHMSEVRVKVLVKDVNDNPPVFPNETIFGDVQENGPIDLTVAVVSAWDADDASDGSNALVTYSIDKNVVDERSGQAIFAIHPDTGLIRTTVCCLDRETTPEYHIQVVAVDGGGLKATSTVLVRLVDVNDNSPRLTRNSYEISVNETWGLGPPSNDTLLKVTTIDQDTSNYFLYRVVESSGWGSEHFGVRTTGNKGELYSIKTLDFEDPAQRRGFHFMIQVTDRGRGGWSDPRHTHNAWVRILLLDLNDNPPEFQRPHNHVTVREDTTPGTLLLTMPAFDPDMSGKQGISYHITGGWGALKINSAGGITLWRAIDREIEGGEMGVAKIIGVDQGSPTLTSTATLTIIVTDVNDTPPRLLPPTVLHLVEGTPASRLGILTATDDDVWTLGNGPPFNLSMATSNPSHVVERITLKFDSAADSGRGAGELWSLKPIDREEFPELTVEVMISDAGGIATTYPVTVIIDDVNDNPMKPAAKTVYLWKTQGGSSETSLGRVYVEDPDDWDLSDKTFSWAGPPHPLFTLHPHNGSIYVATNVRAGRYELSFSVSDRVWKQEDVSANVTVVVKYLTSEALTHSVPITLSPTTPSAITAGWTPKEGGGGLGMLLAAMHKVVQPTKGSIVEVVSVSGGSTSSKSWRDGMTIPNSFYGSAKGVFSSMLDSQAAASSFSAPFACVWICVKEVGGTFMNPVKLQGLLNLNLQQLENSMKLQISLKEPRLVTDLGGSSLGGPLEYDSSSSSPFSKNSFPPLEDSAHYHIRPSSVASLASKALPLQVVDNNSTSLVTPRLTRSNGCHQYSHIHRSSSDPSCTPTSCLNGGRCIRTETGSRCICPGGSWGRRCKILSRSFGGDGWAWLDPLLPCLPMTLSFEVLTSHSEGLILYSGPLTSPLAYPHFSMLPAMYIQITGGLPQVILQGSQEPYVLTVNSKVNSGRWHKIHLHLNTKGMILMVDSCGRGWLEGATNNSHCLAKLTWEQHKPSTLWESNTPLQLGGLAQPRASLRLHRWSTNPTEENLRGCVSNLKVNGQLIDLGEPAYSSHSEAGCTSQNATCSGGCGWNGHCMGYLRESSCICDPGWTGPECNTPTVPALFSHNSYAKIALSFTPDPYSITTQLRLKARGSPSGVLMELAAQHRSAALIIQLHDGLACASVTGIRSKTQQMNNEVCVESYHLGDGTWHVVRVERHGHNLAIAIDDGDEWLYNETAMPLLSLTDSKLYGDMELVPPDPIFIDKQDGVSIGGLPEYMGAKSVTVHEDLREICIDDIRISGNPLPLPPAVNGTTWGQVTTLQQVESGCRNPDVCANTTCLPPLACHPSWHYTTCSCGPGRYQLSGKCQDVDECVYKPCLHGGTCYNLIPDYRCICGPKHAGNNCQWEALPDYTYHLTTPVVLAALTVSLVMLVVFVIVITVRVHKWRLSRGLQTPNSCTAGTLPEVDTVAETVDSSLGGAGDPNFSTPEKNIMYLSSFNSKLPNISYLPDVSGTNTQSVSHQTTILTDNIKSGTSNVPSFAAEKHSYSVLSVSKSPPRLKISPHPDSKVTAGILMPLPVQDDLRAYAYEGGGTPLDSLGLGLCGEGSETDGAVREISHTREPDDLLQYLPAATPMTSVVVRDSHRSAVPVLDKSFVLVSPQNLDTKSSSTVSTRKISSQDGDTIC